ncbi:MAG TPA: endolytic transglycosylase MltG [Actinomycetota bacterium]|nr:endolytic transglycosylase MltG [Actinomycetota bacterium]
MSRARHARRSPVALGLMIVLLVMVLMSVGAGGFYLWATGASGESRPVSLEIPEGATTSDIAALLQEKKVIRSGFAFRVAARLRGLGSSIGAGQYALQTNMPVQEALDVLEQGPIVETFTVTIPEGLRVEQVAERVAEDLGLSRKEFLASAKSGAHVVPPYLPEGSPSVEGFLFPKTYEFITDVSEDQVIRRLLEQFEEEVGGLDWNTSEGLGFSPYELVIIASLIEREAKVDEERAKIASVIYNRLREEMLLQIDATVEYALPEHKNRLTYEDYEYPSPYNTYLHPGLPPTPIASPSLASIEAALRPAKTDLLFYLVVDPETGRHAFAETYQEFLNLKAQAQSA